MAKTTRVPPSRAASGSQTFSDSLVGNQITDGTSQLTNANFALDKVIPEKDSKNFRSVPFSDFLTLDDLKIENNVPTTIKQSNGEKRPIRFNKSKTEASKSLFGSLRERIRVSIERIAKYFPSGLYVDADSISGINQYTAENISYDVKTNITSFTLQSSKIYNPFDIELKEPSNGVIVSTENENRKFYSSFSKYALEISGNTYGVISYTEPDNNNVITLEVDGKPFNSVTYSQSYLIRPTNAVVEEFFLGLDELEASLLNRESFPIYQTSFRVPETSLDETKTELISVLVNWPLSFDGWNIKIVGSEFENYAQQLNDLATEIDDYKSNLVTRFLTAPQLFEFDTEDQKIDKIFQLYGQSFDKVKDFIDNIAYMRNVSYDALNNIPDVFLKNLTSTLGLESVNLFDETTLEEQIYNSQRQVYEGVSTGKNLVEAELEFYRRLLVNLSFIYKSKGTRSSIEFFLRFIGAPEPLIKIDEFVYKVESALPRDIVDDDIFDVINGIKTTTVLAFNTGTTYTYTGTTLTGATTVSQITDYPIQTGSTYLPAAPTTNPNVFFQLGAGWNDITLQHRSSDTMDTELSVLSGRTKTLKTKSKPYTYGEDYFDIFRKLPGLDYGFNLTSEIDNVKGNIIDDLGLESLTLNRKNINIFISPANGINYDIWRKSRDLVVTFGTNSLEPQVNTSFAEFLENVVSSQVTNSHVIRYRKNYIQLEDVYQDYINQLKLSGYTPYDMIDVATFVNKMSPYWTNILEQIVPATTLWLGGNLIENSVFGRPKYDYVEGCQPLEITEVLYPDFETILKEDWETYLGGGDALRGLITVTGATYNLIIDIDGVQYSKKLTLTANDLFDATFDVTSNCTNITDGSYNLPLVCDYKDHIDDHLDITNIKLLWKNALISLINDINDDETTHYPGYVNYAPYLNAPGTKNTAQTNPKPKISYEIFKDSDGVEKIKFTSYKYDTDECTVKEYLDYYFAGEYAYPQQTCAMFVTGFTECDIFDEQTEDCKLRADVYFTVTGGTGNEKSLSNWPYDVHYECSTSYQTQPNRPALNYITYTQSGVTNYCTYRLSDVYEDDQIDLLFTDAANCEQKVRIDGLQLKVEHDPFNKSHQQSYTISSYKEITTKTCTIEAQTGITFCDNYTGYTIHPKLQYRPSFDYGLKHDSYVLKLANTSVNISSWQNIQSGITAGTISGVSVSNISVGDYVLSAQYVDCPYPSSAFKNVDANGYSFNYTYHYLQVTNKDCLSSIKSDYITGTTANGGAYTFQVLPTTKLRVYTKRSVLNEEIPYTFMEKYPEQLFVRPEDPIEPCCDYPEDYYESGDFLINQLGFPIEVKAVNLDYCSRELFYHLNCTGSTLPYNTSPLILFNGNASHQLLLEHTHQTFENMDMSLDHYYVDPINSGTYNGTGIYPYDVDCAVPDVNENREFVYSGATVCSVNPIINCDVAGNIVTPTPTYTVTPTKSVTPTYTITPTQSVTPTYTATPTLTPTITPTVTVTQSLTPTYTVTSTPTLTPTITPTVTPDCFITATAVEVTPEVTLTPTVTPTLTPLSGPDATAFLYYEGYICNVMTNWTTGTTQDAKNGYLDAANPAVRGTTYQINGSGFKYYSSQGPFGVGTSIHYTFSPYQIITTLNGNYLYPDGGGISIAFPNYGNNKFVVTLVNGVVTAMINLNDLGSYTPTTC